MIKIKLLLTLNKVLIIILILLINNNKIFNNLMNKINIKEH